MRNWWKWVIPFGFLLVLLSSCDIFGGLNEEEIQEIRSLRNEIFQAIKNDVAAQADAPIPLVMGLTNADLGYAVDRQKAAEGGYAADFVPLMCQSLPFADIHGELVEALLALDTALASSACVT